MLDAEKKQIAERLKLDLVTIRQERSRTDPLALRGFRWIGEPYGWRTYGDLANDIESLLKTLE